MTFFKTDTVAGVIPEKYRKLVVGISKNQVSSCPMGIGYLETPYIEIATPPAAARNDTFLQRYTIINFNKNAGRGACSRPTGDRKIVLCLYPIYVM